MAPTNANTNTNSPIIANGNQYDEYDGSGSDDDEELSPEDLEHLESFASLVKAGSSVSIVNVDRRVSRTSLQWFQKQTSIVSASSSTVATHVAANATATATLLDAHGNVSDDYILKRQSVNNNKNNRTTELDAIPMLVDLTKSDTITRIDGATLTQLVLSGFAKMASQVEELNNINVFPIPDGDTGANMKVCLKIPARNLVSYPSDDILTVVSNLAADVLLNGQGNSGTILSHFFVSLAEQIRLALMPGSASLTIDAFARCLSEAGLRMDEAVPNPVEGTLLSVCRDCCQLVGERSEESFSNLKELLQAWQAKAKAELAKTPDQLIVDGVKVLEKAGVVDSGAQGFAYFVDGMWLACLDQLPEAKDPKLFQSATASAVVDEPHQHVDHTVCNSKYRYCTETVVLLKDGATKADILASVTGDDANELGDSVACVGAPAKEGGCMVKLHIHSNHPQKVFDRVRQFSRDALLKKEKVEDMYAMREHAHEQDAEQLDLSDAKFTIVGLCSMVLPPKLRSPDLVTLPVFLVPSDTQEPIDARFATDSETCNALNAQRHPSTAIRYTTAASNPMQIKIELLGALSKGKPLLVFVMSKDKRLSALGRNIMQAIELLSPDQQKMVIVLVHGWAVYEAPLLLEAMACAREGKSVNEAYEQVKSLADCNFFFCSMCSSNTVGKLVRWRPGLFPAGFTVADGEFFSFGLAPEIREGEIWSDMKRAGYLMNRLGQAPSLDDLQDIEVERIKATLKPGQAVASVMVSCVGRPDLGEEMVLRMKAAGIRMADEPFVYNSNLLAAATGGWGEMSVFYKVVNA